MDYFLKQYKKICKEQFSGYDFKSYKNNHYRIINDVFQSFELHRSVYGDSCTVHFGALPMCRMSPIDASTCPAMHLKMFENDFSWFPYDNKSEESINDCVNELKQYIANAAFSVCPSEWYENCPMTIIESLSLATPVIGSDLGGIPELISNNYTGLIFKHNDKEDLKKKISYLWENDEMISKMSKNAINSSDNTIEKYTEKLLKIYGECVKHND